MDAGAHVRRSPAVRARHFGKRWDFGQFANDDGLPSSDSSDAGFPTDSNSGDISTTDPAFLPLHTSSSDVGLTTDSGDTSTTSDSDTPTSTLASTSTTTTSVTTTTFPTSTPTASNSVAATPTPSSSNANASSSSSKSMSSGAIAAVVAILVIILLGVVLFFVRKKFIRNRQMKRATWSAGAFAKHNNFGTEKNEANAAAFMPGAGNRSSYGAATNPPAQQQVAFVPPVTITPPPMSYNSVAPPSASLPPSVSPEMTGVAVGMERSSAAPTPSDALIKCTFIPSLPDELSITTGETVRVVAEYDDGWAMCANSRGEQGMVPLECLDKSKGSGVARSASGSSSVGFQGQGDWRGSRRVSSLPPPRY